MAGIFAAGLCVRVLYLCVDRRVLRRLVQRTYAGASGSGGGVRGGVLFPLQRYAGAAHPGAGVPLCSVHAEYAGHLCVQMICLGIGFLIPNYAQLVLHQNAFAAGCLLLPGCIVGAAVSPFSGRLLDRFGAKRPILIGSLAILFAAVCFGVFTLQLNAAMFLVIYLFLPLVRAVLWATA